VAVSLFFLNPLFVFFPDPKKTLQVPGLSGTGPGTRRGQRKQGQGQGKEEGRKGRKERGKERAYRRRGKERACGEDGWMDRSIDREGKRARDWTGTGGGDRGLFF
jgi:hypothetical protein